MWRPVNVALGTFTVGPMSMLTPVSVSSCSSPIFCLLGAHTSELVSEFSHKIQSENDKLFSALTFKMGKTKRQRRKNFAWQAQS